MIIKTIPEYVSYKNRTIKINGQWVKAGKHLDLNEIRVNKLNELIVIDDINGEKIISEVLNVREIN